MTQHNIARVYSIMQELQQLRDKTRKLSEKNVELAKALTATKQELTKARAAQRAVFSNKVLKWMETRDKPVKVQHQAIQCSYEELDRTHVRTHGCEEKVQLEPDPPLSPGTFASYSSSAVEPIMFETDPMGLVQDKATDKTCQRTEDDEAEDDSFIPERVANCRNSTDQDVNIAWLDNQARLRQCVIPPPVDLEQTNVQDGVIKRLRQRDARVSYVEPKLNTKLRRGDYYGLGKRASQPKNTRRMAKHRVVSESRRTKAAFVPARFGQQFSPFRSRRSVQRISYAEPKLNTKLRQGDKFTFTT